MNIIPVMDWRRFKSLPGGTARKDWSQEKCDAFLGAIKLYLGIPGMVAQFGAKSVAEKLKSAAAAHAKGFQTPGATGTTPGTQVVDPYQIERYIEGTAELDLGYEDIFALVDMRGTKKDNFTIYGASQDCVWAERKPGESTVIYPMGGDKTKELQVDMMEFAAGLGILDRWLEFEQFWHVDEALADFRQKMFVMKALVFYGMVEALSAGINQAFVTNDIKTMNAGMVAIAKALRTKGYPIANPKFGILAPLDLTERLDYAMASVRIPYAVVDNQVASFVFPIDKVTTTLNLTATDKYYVYLRSTVNKAKRGEWKDLTVETERDMLKSATDIGGVVQFGGGIGEPDQFRRCSIS